MKTTGFEGQHPHPYIRQKVRAHPLHSDKLEYLSYKQTGEMLNIEPIQVSNARPINLSESLYAQPALVGISSEENERS